MLNKKFVFIGIGIIVLLGVIGGGYYWWTGTPEYSINQIKKAIETHNSELGLKYIDTDAIFENLWTDMKSELMKETEKAEGFEAFGMMLGVQLAESMKPVLKEQFRQGIESWFSAPTEGGRPEETTSTKKASELSTIWQKDLEIKKQGDSAYIELPDNIKVVLIQKEGERYWVVSEIEGFTVFFGGEETEQETKKQGIVLPNRLKEKVDVELLSYVIRSLLGSNEFFINKAIGWVLRNYSKTDPDWVTRFADKTELSNLSRREAIRLMK